MKSEEITKGLAVRLFNQFIKGRLKEVGGGGCVVYTGKKNKQGYGILYFAGEEFLVHCVTFIAERKEIPIGKIIRHRCVERGCCRIGHLMLSERGRKKGEKNRKVEFYVGSKEEDNSAKIIEGLTKQVKD